MTYGAITKGQLKRLQVLYAQLARHTQQDAGREARLAWAAGLVGRSIESFSELTFAESQQLIDTVQGQLGVKAPRRMDRDAAYKAGTEGRRGRQSKQMTLATAEDFARIQHGLQLVGWSQEQLDGWLRSSRSPLGKRANPKILTLGDANRVWWALKRMAQRSGAWKEVA